MKKIILLLILSVSNTFAQKLMIEKNSAKYNPKLHANFYQCKESNNLFQEGLAKINFIDNQTFYIENQSNTGYTGIHISFKINKQLEIFEIDYYTWDDIEDGSSVEFYIEDFELTLNKNPFKEDIKNLRGFYILKIKSNYDPGEMLSRENVEPRTETFEYRGGFECI